jgi:hypothetical protein
VLPRHTGILDCDYAATPQWRGLIAEAWRVTVLLLGLD